MKTVKQKLDETRRPGFGNYYRNAERAARKAVWQRLAHAAVSLLWFAMTVGALCALVWVFFKIIFSH